MFVYSAVNCKNTKGYPIEVRSVYPLQVGFEVWLPDVPGKAGYYTVEKIRIDETEAEIFLSNAQCKPWRD